MYISNTFTFYNSGVHNTSKTAVRQMAGILSRPNPSAEFIGSPKSDGDDLGHKIVETEESKLIQNNKQVVIIQSFNGTLNL